MVSFTYSAEVELRKITFEIFELLESFQHFHLNL